MPLPPWCLQVTLCGALGSGRSRGRLSGGLWGFPSRQLARGSAWLGVSLMSALAAGLWSVSDCRRCSADPSAPLRSRVAASRGAGFHSPVPVFPASPRPLQTRVPGCTLSVLFEPLSLIVTGVALRHPDAVYSRGYCHRSARATHCVLKLLLSVPNCPAGVQGWWDSALWRLVAAPAQGPVAGSLLLCAVLHCVSRGSAETPVPSTAPLLATASAAGSFPGPAGLARHRGHVAAESNVETRLFFGNSDQLSEI